MGFDKGFLREKMTGEQVAALLYQKTAEDALSRLSESTSQLTDGITSVSFESSGRVANMAQLVVLDSLAALKRLEECEGMSRLTTVCLSDMLTQMQDKIAPQNALQSAAERVLMDRQGVERLEAIALDIKNKLNDMISTLPTRDERMVRQLSETFESPSN